MLTIIEIKDREDGGHGLQSQSHRTECWLEGWLAVPPELEQTAWDCAGYCDLDIQDGKLVGLTPREQPPKPEPEPDLTPQFRTAMLSYAATSTAIPDSYALDMSDLFPTWAAVLADGEELPEGRVLNDGGQLYRVVQAVTPQAHQAPHDEGMLAVYRPIDREHAGTADDPIPWVYGMDCHAGKCYRYNGKVYQVAEGGDMIPCTWPPDTPGMWQWEEVQAYAPQPGLAGRGRGLMDHINGFKAAVAAVLGCLTALWGWFGWLVVAWVACMLLDYATGTAAALKAGKWSCKAAREGLWHKVGAMAAVLVAAILDGVLGLILDHIPALTLPFDYTVFLTVLVLVWYILTELGSIVENAGRLGAPLPAWLSKAIAALESGVDSTGDKLTQGEKKE